MLIILPHHPARSNCKQNTYFLVKIMKWITITKSLIIAVNCKVNTVECRYKSAQLITISFMARNLVQTSNSQQTPHTSPSRGSYGVCIVTILEETDRVITVQHCIIRSVSHTFVTPVGIQCMMPSSNGNIFRVTGPLRGESTVRPLTRSFDVFFDLRLKKTVEQTIETPVSWDTIALIMTSL